MLVRTGLQVIRLANGDCRLVYKTKNARYIDILGVKPEDYTDAMWKVIKDTAVKSVKDWISHEKDGFGLIVYESECYEFSSMDRTKLLDWPDAVRDAFYWLKRNFPQEDARVLN